MLLRYIKINRFMHFYRTPLILLYLKSITYQMILDYFCNIRMMPFKYLGVSIEPNRGKSLLGN